MMFKKQNLSFSLALKCALLFLAISVFGWGVQAKLALYHTDQNKISTTNSMAKLSTETRSARSAASVESPMQPGSNWESMHFAAVVFALQGRTLAPVSVVGQVEPEWPTAGFYNLHSPHLMRRPPPALV